MKKTLIKNAKICIKDNETAIKDILFSKEGILDIGDDIQAHDATIINAKQRLVLPGLIDVHVHLREPGYEHKETIHSGTKAAAKGGFTTIMAMPNVSPAPDNVDTMKRYMAALQQKQFIDVIPYACITKQEKGEEVVDMQALKQLSVHAFSDDGVGVASTEVMRQAMIKSKQENVLVVAHTEDMHYRKPDACMHEGIRNKELGYIGIPSACEYEQVKRDLRLVEETDAHYHICHMSAKESVQMLKEAKQKGLDVSGEVSVHHLLLNETDVKDDANYKMNPPLRGKDDQEALLQGLLEGVIDMIANDHAPHSEKEKAKGMIKSPFGIVALETAFPLLYTNLVLTGKVTLQQLITWMSANPAKRFKMHRKGKLEIGYQADLIMVDESKRIIDKNTFVSKGKNTPFDQWECNGFCIMTFVNGTCIYKEELL